MSRVKIKFPAETPLIECFIPVRITDINYGNHLGNDRLLAILHEARVQCLAQWKFTELNAGGNSLIMADVMIAYRGEAFYGDVLQIKIFTGEISERSFDLLYDISTERNNQQISIAQAKTAMVCFDYEIRKVTLLKDELKARLKGL
ncbi:MAG: thioesterase family protein [Bacteroidetes bacterium]|nr:thioesterase family protein [Bacteroidota bacterium]MBS1740346.1 thioesterase family protein [Bacteroidota bacterium]MBS1776832.1 thioesterase family protein [Bacteroidota bacterium]